MTVDEIRELIALTSDSGLAELEVQHGDDRVRIRRAGFAPQEIVLAPPSYAAAGPVQAAAPAPAPAAAPAPTAAAPGADPNLALVKSPIVGTFYECPSPGAPPFVRLGEKVQPGKVLCIIESMKLMNEIECEITRVVESKLVLSGQPVEYGEALFAIRTV
jgi:acetyl-CoA carboxylase biotin carboxyl carrier protein